MSIDELKKKNAELLSLLKDTEMKKLAQEIGLVKVCPFRTHNTELLKQIEAIKLVDDPVLIIGESGTGKELIAQMLHKSGPFVVVNVTAVSDSLFESELFGHEKGSFTGAHSRRPGLVEHASGGTLFLDEIGDMGYGLQAKILRLVQNKVYRPVGSNEELPMKCRVVCATHADLKNRIKDGRFRLDLYERISVLVIRIPPLRDRIEDIKLLCSDKMFSIIEPFISRIERSLLLPGNVRQLQNILRRIEVLGPDSIKEADFM